MDPPTHLQSQQSTSPKSPGSRGSWLLAALPANALSLLQPHLRQREFSAGTLLWEAGDAEHQIYFPHAGLVSIAITSREGHAVEVGSVSREGAAGVLDLADGRPAARAVVLIAGTFSYMPAHRLAELERHSPELAALAARCREWILLQSQHMAACNATHSAEARFCRWLLLAADRMECDTVAATQEEIGALLGIRRTTVTLVAQKLQSTGTIHYSRGKIAIRDRKALQALACSCYHALAPGTWPSHRLGQKAASVRALSGVPA
jgi:CRP-like cAMP-binding protein